MNFHRSARRATSGSFSNTLSRPEAGRFGAAVEVVRLVKHGEIVVAHQRRAAAGRHQIQAFHRIRAIADDVAEADDVLDPAPVDLGEDRAEGFEVAVNVTDDREHIVPVQKTNRESYGWCAEASINRKSRDILDFAAPTLRFPANRFTTESMETTEIHPLFVSVISVCSVVNNS